MELKSMHFHVKHKISLLTEMQSKFCLLYISSAIEQPELCSTANWFFLQCVRQITVLNWIEFAIYFIIVNESRNYVINDFIFQLINSTLPTYWNTLVFYKHNSIKLAKHHTLRRLSETHIDVELFFPHLH